MSAADVIWLACASATGIVWWLICLAVNTRVVNRDDH